MDVDKVDRGMSRGRARRAIHVAHDGDKPLLNAFIQSIDECETAVIVGVWL